jgi:hypothetical protein
MTRNPYFSIVTPVVNRERIIRRAIDSCLAQDFGKFELIVVDDGSTDNTAEVVLSYLDPRVRLIRHSSNRGAGPSRNSAIRSAHGEWIICLDSDDELLPGCLSRVFDAISSDQDGIGRLGFLYTVDGRAVSPGVLPPPGPLGYEDWLRFIEAARLSDALWVARRDTFACCMMQEGFGPDLEYHLDFSRCFRWKLVPEIVAVIHTDSNDRLSCFQRSGDVEKELRRQMDRVAAYDAVLAKHGPVLRQHAPGMYRAILRARAVSWALAGRRWRSLAAAAAGVVRSPGSFADWAVFGMAVIGRRAMRWARALHAYRHSRSVTSDNEAHAGRSVLLGDSSVSIPAGLSPREAKRTNSEVWEVAENFEPALYLSDESDDRYTEREAPR